MMRDKLGLFGRDKGDLKLINDLLNWMEINQADFTNTFCHIMKIKVKNYEIYQNQDFINWSNKWQQRQSKNGNTMKKSLELMKDTNPIIIPRNHKVEEALSAATEGNYKILNELLYILKNPYSFQEIFSDYRHPSDNKNYQTFCGT